MARRRIVILGNGGAACHAVMAARAAGFTGEILMLSDVDELAFNPMLAPYYLNGRLSWECCHPFGEAFYRCYAVDCRFGSAVIRLDARARSVMLADGSEIGYDSCLVATGADASIPPVPGLQSSPFAFPLRTSHSTRRLEKVLLKARKAVVLGASLVGLKVAEILAVKGVRTLVVDVANQVMPRGAHPVTAAFLQRYFEQQGVEFQLGCALQGLEEQEGGVCCFFPEVIVEDTDFIGVCTGIRANLDFVDREQVHVGQGVVTDACGRSSVAGLYAAGDCAQAINLVSGRYEWLGTWSNACYQGRAAGLAMVGRPLPFYGGISQHISPLFRWTYAQIGQVDIRGGNVRIVTCGDPFADKGRFSLYAYDGNRLVGANLINCTDQIGAVRQSVVMGRTWHPMAGVAWDCF